MTKHTQSGNALWFILVAILLLGALTVLLSKSSETSNDSGDFERNQIQVSDLARYVKSIEIAISGMKSRGCSEAEINFDTPAIAGYTNPDAPTDDSCDVFSDKGGGMAYKQVQPIYLDPTQDGETLYGHWVFNGAISIPSIGTDGGGIKSNELVMVAPFLSKEFCMKINDFLGRPNPLGNPPAEDDTTKAHFLTQFIGTFTAGSVLEGGGAFAAKTSGCTKASDNASYYYFQVLSPR